MHSHPPPPKQNCDGHNVVDPNTGGNTWVPGPKTNQTYLVLHDPEAAGEAIDALLCQAPLARS